MESEWNVVVLVGLLLLMLAVAKLFGRLGLPGCTISGDYETICYNGRLYTFLCCTYSDRQRGERSGSRRPRRRRSHRSDASSGGASQASADDNAE